jgi:hypothetical protein
MIKLKHVDTARNFDDFYFHQQISEDVYIWATYQLFDMVGLDSLVDVVPTDLIWNCLGVFVD